MSDEYIDNDIFSYDDPDLPENIEIEDEDISGYRSDDGEQYDEFEQNEFNHGDGHSFISQEIGFKDQDRYGMSHVSGGEELPGTIGFIGNKRMEQMSRTPEEIFSMMVNNIVQRYDFPKEVFNDCISVRDQINKTKQKLKFKSPKAIVFALLIFEGKDISKKKFNKVFNDYAKKEGLTKMDLLKYCIFIKNLRKH